jgi:diacylglycerol kinase family enzyme
VHTQLIERPGVAIRRVRAVVNPASGSVGPETAGELAALFAEHGLDYRATNDPDRGIEEAVRAAIDDDPDLMVVVGGDGTARLVAEMCGPSGPLVAPLSGGTMNKLGRTLYGAKPWREALAEVLVSGEPRWMPGGEVGGHSFFCSAVLGSPSLWARAREAVRARAYSRAWRYARIAARRAFLARVRYEFNGEEIGRGMAIGLICPSVSRAFDSEERALEAAVLDLRDVKAGVRLALSNFFGDWRADPDVTVRPCARGRVWARDPIPAMLDGEYFRFGRQTEISFRPRAFRALAPATIPEAPA